MPNSYLTHSTSESPANPFAPITVVPTSSVGGGAPTARRVYLPASATRSSTGDSSTGEEQRHVGTVPAQQLLLSNRDIRAMAQEIAAKTSWEWAPRLTLFDGQHLAYGLVAETLSVEGKADGGLTLGLLFQNSYDGSWEPGTRLFAYRPGAATGLLHGQHFGEVRFLCGPSDGGWSADLQRVRQYLETAEGKLHRFARHCEDLQGQPIGASDLSHLRQRPLSGLPQCLWGQLMEQFLHGPPLTAWGLLTSGTALLWGQSGAAHPDPDPDIVHYNQLLTEAVVGHIPVGDTTRW